MAVRAEIASEIDHPLDPSRLQEGRDYLHEAPRSKIQTTEIHDIPGVTLTVTAVHDTLLGQFNDQGPSPYGTSLGGTRVVFEEEGHTPESATRLAQDLASDMTKKHLMLYRMMNKLHNNKQATDEETWATMMGGSKSVILAKNKKDFPKRASESRRELFRQHAYHILRLGGAITAVDMYTETTDMDVVAEVTGGKFVACQSVEKGGTGNPSPTTAVGVWHGAEALLRMRNIPPESAHYQILGVGAVGSELTRLIATQQAKENPVIYIADIDGEKASKVVKDLSDTKVMIMVYSPTRLHIRNADIFMPAAGAGILTREFLTELHPDVRIIAGAANDIWPMLNGGPDPEIVELYFRRGIAVAPAWVVNMGGILHASTVFWKNWGGPPPNEARARELVAGVGSLMKDIYALSEKNGQPMEVIASDMVAETLVLHAQANKIPLSV